MTVWCLRLLSFAGMVFSGDLAAAIFTVGSPVGAGQCTDGTIQSAINAAESNPGADTVRLTRSLTYEPEAVQINTSQHLDVVGGFETCAQAATDNIKTTISGAGGALEPVFRITGHTGAIITLRHLTLTNGDQDGGDYGGGIYFRGDGVLELIESTISNSVAGYGGGIYAEGLGSNAELILGADVLISNNVARYSGGGIYADGVEMTMNAPGSTIAFNEAVGVFNAVTGQVEGGYGGGIQLVGGSRDGYAYIGSPGLGGLGPIYANQARHGGGVSVMSLSDEVYAELQVYSTDPTRQTAIRDNFATVAGGGLYVWAEDRSGFLIGYAARAELRNASLLDNAAPDGAAAYLARTPGLFPVGYSGLFINPSTAGHPDALPCVVGRACTYISGNVDQNLAGDPTGGAVLLVDRENELTMDRTEVSGNRGGRVLRAVGGSTYVEAVNTLWTDNTTSQELMRTEDDVDLLLENSTFAGNAIGAAAVLSANGRFRMQRSVLWQPGKTSLVHGGGTRFAENIVTSERLSLDGGSTPYVLEASPRFVDLARSDYTLQAASPAVDFASTGGGPDLAGHDRAIDLPIKGNRMGSGDLGAYERQSLQPLVLNADFDIDTNLWPEAVAGVSTWVGDQNASGAAGSGSVRVSQENIPQTRVTARSQCIHLPGPGRYLLNGWGRSGFGPIGTRDSVLLHWQLRRNGEEACNAGPPDASGDHFLSTSNSWGRPASAAIIDVPADQWTHTSSITVLMTVIDNGITSPPTVTGWFDGVTLEVEASDVIFADDFDFP